MERHAENKLKFDDSDVWYHKYFFILQYVNAECHACWQSEKFMFKITNFNLNMLPKYSGMDSCWYTTAHVLYKKSNAMRQYVNQTKSSVVHLVIADSRFCLFYHACVFFEYYTASQNFLPNNFPHADLLQNR